MRHACEADAGDVPRGCVDALVVFISVDELERRGTERTFEVPYGFGSFALEFLG